MSDHHRPFPRLPRRPARSAGLVLVLVVAVAVSACGTSAGSDHTAAKAGTAAPANTRGGSTNAGSAGSATTRPAGPAKPIDICATVDAAKASQLSGQAITRAEPEHQLNAMEYGCDYSNPNDASAGFGIQVYEHGAEATYNEYFHQSGKTLVHGLGDKAFYATDKELFALSGSSLINVTGVEGADKCAALARPVLAAL